MVDNFQKNYDALQIPYPKDTASTAIDQQAVQQKADFEKFVAASKTRIAGRYFIPRNNLICVSIIIIPLKITIVESKPILGGMLNS